MHRCQDYSYIKRHVSPVHICSCSFSFCDWWPDGAFSVVGDHDKVQQLDRRVTELAGFSSCYTVCGQTYPRKVDVQLVQALASLGATAHKVSGCRVSTQ